MSQMKGESAQKQLVVLDQTFVVFDIEQPRNAQQKLKLNRLTGVGPIYWRFQTNAPTRYIVNPNTGYLKDDDQIEVTITLFKNRYRPRHEIFLQAVQVGQGNVDQTAFEDLENVQTIYLDCGTTVMNIEKAVENHKSSSQADLSVLLDESSTKGSERIEQLESILKMTKTDTETLTNNIQQSKQLKNVLQTQLEEKGKMIEEFKAKVALLEGSYMKKNAEVDRLQHEVSTQMKLNAMKPKLPPNNCSIS